MYITPRPALLCRGTGYEIVSKPNCIVDKDLNGNVIGCKAYSSSCEDPSNASYCPANSGCQYKMINCVNGSLTSAKTGCTASTTETTGTLILNNDIICDILLVGGGGGGGINKDSEGGGGGGGGEVCIANSFKLSTADFESINLTEDSQVYLSLTKRVSHNN
jgi:hypothetical protein